MRIYPASSLETRLSRVERTNRLLVVVCIATASLLLLAHTVPQLAPDVIRAERYQLVDATGSVKAELRLDDGNATLLLLDEAGNVRATLSQANADAVGGLRVPSAGRRADAPAAAHPPAGP